MRRLDPDCGQKYTVLALPVLLAYLTAHQKSTQSVQLPDDHADGEEEADHDDDGISLPCRVEQSEEEHESGEDVEKLAVHGSLL
jgi:hypothetical protein